MSSVDEIASQLERQLEEASRKVSCVRWAGKLASQSQARTRSDPAAAAHRLQIDDFVRSQNEYLAKAAADHDESMRLLEGAWRPRT